MPIPNAAKHLMLDALDETATGGCDYLSLHSAFPGATGTSEISGGSPAYARKACTWNAAASGAKATASAVTFDVAAATTVMWYGMWDAVTSGTYLGCGPLGASSTLKVCTVDAGDVTANTITSPGHGFVNNDRVVLIDTAGTLPTGITEGTAYHVVGAATDTFQVSTTQGGAAVDITAAGVAVASLIVPETFAGQGTYQLTTATLDLQL